MGGIKRLVLLVFSLAAALCLAALALPWVGPYQKEATDLIVSNDYYYLVLQVVFVITALGVVITFLRALFAPRKRKTITVSKAGGDAITVTTAAVSSQASHVVESAGQLAAERVQVDTKRNGDVRVSVRVRPHVTVNVVEEGQRLHDDLMSGLATVCGSKIKGVSLQFVEADQAEPDPEPQPIEIETHVEPEPAALGEAQPKPKHRLFGFGRPAATPAPEPEAAPEPEPAPEEPEHLTLDDLVIPASVYERAAEAEQADAVSQDEGITVPLNQVPSEAPKLDDDDERESQNGVTEDEEV